MTTSYAEATAESDAEDFQVFDLAEFGEIDAMISRDGQTGALIYRVTGPRVTGALSVTVARPLRTPRPTWVEFGYGIGYGLPATTDPALWSERLTVNSVELVGRASEIQIENLAHALEPVRAWAKVRRPAQRFGGDEPAPRATIARTLPLLSAVLADFAARADLPQLHRYAAARHAAVELERAKERMADLAQARTDLQRTMRDAQARADLLRHIADPAAPGDPYELLTAH